jgi:hypothetical protein
LNKPDASRPRYDHEARKWVPQCPYGDICTGCDAAGECARAWWYDDNGKVIVTADDRFHGEEANRCRGLVESLSSWDDVPLWQYRLDLLREAIEHEQATVDREKRSDARDCECHWNGECDPGCDGIAAKVSGSVSGG